MERLPSELCLKILGLLDHRNLAAAQIVCREWKVLGSEDSLWRDLFKERWGEKKPFAAPCVSRSWKNTYTMQDTCDRFHIMVFTEKDSNELKVYDERKWRRYTNTAKTVEEDKEP